MRSRLLAVTAVLMVVAAACGSGEPSTAPDVAAKGVVLAYGYETGGDLSYRFEMGMDMVAALDAPGVPGGDMRMGMDMAGTTTYSISDGPEPGTVKLRLRHRVDDVEIRELSVDGQSMAAQIDAETAAALAEAQAGLPEVEVVLDSRGNVLSMEMGGQDLPVDLFGGDLFGSMDPTGGLTGLEGFLGPAFPDGKVAVGSEWTDETVEEVPFIGEMKSRTRYKVVREGELSGRKVFVVESTTEIEPIELDFVEMLEELAEADAATLEAFGMSRGEVGLLLSEMGSQIDMKLRMVVEDATGTSWFDPADGLLVRSEMLMQAVMTMDMKIPGQGSMSMDADMALDFTLHLAGA